MYVNMKKLLFSGVLVASLAGIGTAGEITGTVSYRERIALPPNSIITVRLEDVSAADRASVIISELKFVSGSQQVPFGFRLQYADTAIQKGHRYQVRSSIHAENQLMFTSSTAYPVISNGAKKANILVQRVAPSANLILGITWKLTELNGKPSLPGRSGSPSITFNRDGSKFSSNTGVNSLSGAFKLTGGSINIRPGIQTLIGASPELMQQEKDFSAALRATTSYRLVNGKLELIKGSEIVARFEQ